NFSVIPHVNSRDAFWDAKQLHKPKHEYEDIIVPKNTASGIYIATFAFLGGFGFVWHIVWLIAVSILGVIVFTVARTFNDDIEYILTAAEVEKLEDTRAKQ